MSDKVDVRTLTYTYLAARIGEAAAQKVLKSSREALYDLRRALSTLDKDVYIPDWGKIAQAIATGTVESDAH